MKKKILFIVICIVTVIINTNVSSGESKIEKINIYTNYKKVDSRIKSNKENVIKKFKQFYIYGPMSNPTIDLSDNSSLIKTYSQANNILKYINKNKKQIDKYF